MKPQPPSEPLAAVTRFSLLGQQAPRPPPGSAEVSREATTAVLDTNAALDWLVFADPGMQRLADALQRGAVQWVASTRMRLELAHMLLHASLARWQPDARQALAQFDRWVHLLPEPPPALRIRCSDADDQVFVDLALAHHTRWLVTHDRALLKLARRLRPHGVQVLKPAQWPGTEQAPAAPEST